MATVFKAVDNINAFTHINGITISEIERRAKPLQLNSKNELLWDPCEYAKCEEENEYVNLLRMTRSRTGFFGPNESLKQVLLSDWNTVLNELHTTHLEIAEHLSNILSLCPPPSSRPQAYVRVTYNNQPLEIKYMIVRGDHQLDLFANLESEQQQSAWVDEYHIHHSKLGLTIRVAGNKEHGIVQYIQKYGFYEGGGKQNCYRIDPSKLWCIISGDWRPEVVQSEIEDASTRIATLTASQMQLHTQVQQYHQQLQQLRTQYEETKGKVQSGKKLEDSEPTIQDILNTKEEIDGDILYLKSQLKDNEQDIKVAQQRQAQLLQLQQTYNSTIANKDVTDEISQKMSLV